MKNILAKGNATRYWLCCGVAVVLLFGALQAGAQVSGAIFTTNGLGNPVDQNLYPSKTDVYLSGGPNNCKSGSGLSQGTYNFQVTTPNGIVLSSDSLADRGTFHVNSAGYIDTYSGSHTPTINVEVCPGKFSLGIPLAPFAWTTNPGGEYKAWACRTDSAACTQVIATVDAQEHLTNSLSSAFDNNASKTDNFKIQEPRDCTTDPSLPGCGAIIWPIAGAKFYDVNANGVQDVGDGGIRGWRFQVVSACTGLSGATALGGGCLVYPDLSGAPYNTTTDPTGKFRFDGLTAGDSYGVCELFPTPNPGTAWRATSACPHSDPGFWLSTSDATGQLTFGPAYQLGSTNLYGVPYPVTADNGPNYLTGNQYIDTHHLGLGDAMCNDPSSTGTSSLNPLSAFYTNISDVFEWGKPGANFGNRCTFIAGGGLTLGFWSNTNGNYIIGVGNGTLSGVGLLNGLKDQAGHALNIIDNKGVAVTFSSLPCTSPTSNSKFDCWVTNSSNSSDPANQLSVQMVAASLNVALGSKVTTNLCGSNHNSSCGVTTAASFAEAAWGGTTLKYPTFTSGCGTAGGNGGWTTLGCLINEANAAIPGHTNPTSTEVCSVTDGSGNILGSLNCRIYQTGLQNLLNLANNNDTSAQPIDAATGTALCGVNYTGNESCSVVVPLTPPSGFTFPLAPPQP